MFGVLFVLVGLAFGMLLVPNRSLDAWVVEANGNEAAVWLGNGRILTGAILGLLEALGLNVARLHIPLMLLSLLGLAGCAYLLIHLFVGRLPRAARRARFLVSLGCLMSVVNLFVLHWFLFPESTVFMVAALLLAIAAVAAVEPPRSAASIAAGYLLLVASMGLYQAAAAFFVTFALLATACSRQHDRLLGVIRQMLVPAGLWAAAAATNLALVVLFGAGRGRTEFHNLDPARNAWEIILSVADKLQLTGLGVLPVAVLGGVLVVGLALVLAVSRGQSEARWGSRQLAPLGAIVVGTFVASLAPHLVTGEVDVSPRSVAAILSLPGVTVVYIVCRSRGPISRRTWRVVGGFVGVVFATTVIVANAVGASRFGANRSDYDTALLVLQEVERHEQASGIPVTRVAITLDASPTACHPGLICYGNFRAMGRPDVVPSVLSVVGERPFTSVPMPEDVRRGFTGRDWRAFSLDQVRIEGETLYLAIY